MTTTDDRRRWATDAAELLTDLVGQWVGQVNANDPAGIALSFSLLGATMSQLAAHVGMATCTKEQGEDVALELFTLGHDEFERVHSARLPIALDARLAELIDRAHDMADA